MLSTFKVVLPEIITKTNPGFLEYSKTEVIFYKANSREEVFYKYPQALIIQKQ